MNVGIVGLGLIGGSLAKAYAESGDHTVLGTDSDPIIADFALMAQAISGKLDEKSAASCDLILIAIPPKAAITWFETMAPHLSKNTLILDCCGTKQQVCDACFSIAEQHGLTFVGGHPMAGTHKSGFKYARASLFHGAPMVIVPPRFDDMALLERVKTALAPCGFSKFSAISAQRHDEIIAFTSQLAHVVSNAYIKSPTAKIHQGFSAGSYKDLTRVAWLNAPMWTELFMENRHYLIQEIDILIDALGQYRKALQENDSEQLCQLLEEGKQRKQEVDGL